MYISSLASACFPCDMYLVKDRSVSVTQEMTLCAYHDCHNLVGITQGFYAHGCKIRHMHAGFVEIQNKAESRITQAAQFTRAIFYMHDNTVGVN